MHSFSSTTAKFIQGSENSKVKRKRSKIRKSIREQTFERGIRQYIRDGKLGRNPKS